MYSFVGVFGLSAAWVEDPPDSGTLVMMGGRRLQLPYPKTQAYFYIIGMAALATVYLIPPFLAIYFFQKYLLVGMTFGTVRGEV